jgi:hypothetical protein
VAEDGQVFVDYDIVAEPYSTLCSVTTYNKRLYAILVRLLAAHWSPQWGEGFHPFCSQ